MDFGQFQKQEFNGWFLWNLNWCNEILGKLEVYPSLEPRFQLTVFGATRPKCKQCE